MNRRFTALHLGHMAAIRLYSAKEHLGYDTVLQSIKSAPGRPTCLNNIQHLSLISAITLCVSRYARRK